LDLDPPARLDLRVDVSLKDVYHPGVVGNKFFFGAGVIPRILIREYGGSSKFLSFLSR
jgi:hypothetical protein